MIPPRLKVPIFFGLALLFLMQPCLSYGQSPSELLEKGRDSYNRDQLDSARFLYNQAFTSGDANIQIQAIGGLISVSILRSELTAGDSLIQMGDELIRKNQIELKPLCEYKIRKGEFYRSNSKFQQALAQHQEVVGLSKNLKEAPIVYADALYYTALTFERLSAYDSSIIYADKAYEIYKQELDTTTTKFGSIYNGLGVVYYRANRLEEAKQFYLKSKEIAETKLGPISTDLALCLSNLSSISRSEENYKEAVAYTEQALRIFRALKDESGISSAYYSLGVYHYFMGDYGRTKDYLESCIAIRERLYDNNHFSLIGPYEVLGIAFEENGDYEKTLYYLQKARPIILYNYGTGSISEGFNYENTAICYKNTGQIDSSLHYMQLSNKIVSSQLPDNDYSLATNQFNFANINYLLNNFREARALLQQSSRIYETLQMEHSTEYAQNLALQALMYAEEKKWSAADPLFEQALNVIRLPQSLLEQDMAFALNPNSLWLLNEYSEYLYKKFQATQQTEVLELFEKYSQTYLDLSDKFRQQFIDPYTKSILIKDNAIVYNRNIGIYNQLYRQTGKKEYLNAAFKFSEYGRTSLLRDLQDEKIESYAGIPDSILQKERTLKKEISQLNQQLMNNPSSDEIKQALFASKEALNVHVQNTLQNNPRYYDLKFNANIPSLQEVQSQLTKDQHLIEYMQDDTAIYALIISPEEEELLYLANRKSVEKSIIRWKEQIVTQDGHGIHSTGHQLYNQVWKPFEEKLVGKKITIIPVGSLFYLNFETLPSGDDPGSFLIRQYNIGYALSINIQFSDSPKKHQGSMIAIAPGFEENIKQPYQDQLDSLELLDEEYLRTVRQPWSLKLVNGLSKKFSNQVYTGLQATEANIKSSLQKGKILVFGTHAIANSEDPLRSKLVLAKEVGAQTEDGYLHAYELYGIPLEAELAVLNACESGIGNLQAGEGMISLAYSIHYAGCPSTVMSLWKVDEKISTQITEDFLAYLSEGYTKSEALRQAKLDYLDTADPSLRQPFYWGGMVLMGKDGTIELNKKKSPWLWYLGIGIGLALVIGLGRRLLV